MAGGDRLAAGRCGGERSDGRGALWALAPFAWGGFSPEGRWLASAVANACLLIGLTQWLAWRRP
ncbi:MAG: hypothetical protein WHT63_11475 [Tepidiforma sp.]